MKKLLSLGVGAMIIFTLIFPVGLIQAVDDATITETQTQSVATNLGLFGGVARHSAIDPTNTNNVYIITKSPNGLFWSNDGAVTWNSLSGVDYGEGVSVTVNPLNGDVYATLGNNLIKSTDDGATWSDITPSGEFGTGQITYTQSKLLIASTDGKVRISTDGGAAFSTNTVTTDTLWSVAGHQTLGPLYAVSEDVNQTSGKLWISADGGTTWSDLGVAAKGVSSVPFAVLVNPNNPNHVVLISESGVDYQSFNAGTTWSEISGASAATGTFDTSGRLYLGAYYLDSPYTTASNVLGTTSGGSSITGTTIVTDSGAPNVIYIGSGAGMAKSIDRGATWTDQNDGITAVTVNDMSQAKDKNIVWAATSNGLAKSVNFTSSALTWQFPIFPVSNTNADSIWVNPDNPNIVVAPTRGTIYRSTDGGSTWVASTSPLSASDDVAQVIADPDNLNTLYGAFYIGEQLVAKTGGVIKSTDGGITWTSMSLPNNAPAQSIALAKNGDLYVGVGSPVHSPIAIRGIYKYSGGSWSKLSDAPNFEIPAILADPDDEKTVYAGTGDANSGKGSLYKSTDGGETWKKKTVSDDGIREVASLAVQKSTTPNTFYLGAANIFSKGTIYKSSDAGETWGVLYKGLDSESFTALLFDGLLAGNDRGLYGLKSRASLKWNKKKLTIVKGATKELKLTAKDASTKKKLGKRQIRIYRKVGKTWKLWRKTKTDKNGTAILKVGFGKSRTIKAVFKPKSKSDKAEYTQSASKKIRIKVIK